MLIINPGSEISEGNKDKKWTNTHKQARVNAYGGFYKPMEKEGFIDIEVEDTKKENDGRWLFIFKHKITGVSVELQIDGIDDLDEYKKENIFTPRTYWNGSNCSDPDIKDFAKEGYNQ